MDDNMNTDITLTLNQIISNEQSKDAVLKEQLAVKEAVLNLNKSIKELTTQAENAAREKRGLEVRSDQVRAQLEVERIQLTALKEQLDHGKMVAEKLRLDIENGISEVWKLRSDFTKTTQDLSEECDIWALMMKPISTETVLPIEHKSDDDEPILENFEERLKQAVERKQNALAERNRLRTEPDTAEEFIRRYIQLVKSQHHIRRFCSKMEQPIKFSTSKAAQRNTTSPTINPDYHLVPWYQPYSVTLSMAVFMIYFCILREENDIDMEFSKTLYERVDGLEKSQLILSYKYNVEKGLSTEDIERRLKEIEDEKNKLVK